MELPSYEEYYLKSIFDTSIERFKCDSKLETYFKEDAKDTETELIAKTYFLHKRSISDPLVSRKEALEFYRKAGFEDYPVDSANTDNKFLYFDLKAYQEQMRRLFD